MAFHPDIHHRRSIRLRGYDYAQPGAYFVTVCTWQREHLFGHIIDREMRLNGLGDMVVDEWLHTAVKRPSVTLGEFVVMPNHLHAIVIIRTEDGYRPPETGTKTVIAPKPEPGTEPVGARFIAPKPVVTRSGQGVMNHAPTLGDIVRQFKARSTHAINTLQDTRGRPIWQRNYWERIIRSEEEYRALCEYIRQNPAQWQADSLYSAD